MIGPLVAIAAWLLLAAVFWICVGLILEGLVRLLQALWRILRRRRHYRPLP